MIAAGTTAGAPLSGIADAEDLSPIGDTESGTTVPVGEPLTTMVVKVGRARCAA